MLIVEFLEDELVRKCLRCEADMIEELELKLKGSGMSFSVAERGALFGSRPLSDVRLAVCPKCGYTEMYVVELPSG